MALASITITVSDKAARDKFLAFLAAHSIAPTSVSASGEMAFDVSPRGEAAVSLQHLMQSLQEVVYFVDPAGVVRYVSPSVVQLLGRSPDEIIGHKVREFSPPGDLVHMRKAYDAVLHGDQTPREYRLLRADGGICQVRTLTQRVMEGEAIAGLCGVIIDVTRERESESRYSALFQTVNEALFVVDQATGKIVDANVAAERMYSYSHNEMLQLNNSDLSAQPGATLLANADPSGNVELRYHKRKNGNIFPAEISLGQYTANGRTYVITSVRDSSERRRIEQSLRESEDRFARFADEAPAIVILRDQDGRLLYSNRYFKEIFGISGRGETLDALGLRQEDLSTLQQTDAEALHRGSLTTLIKITDRRGTERTFRMHKFTVPRAEKPSVFGVLCIDVTDMARTQEALQGALRHNAAILETAIEGFHLIDDEGRILEVNPAFSAIEGYSREELLHMNVRDLDAFIPGEELVARIKTTAGEPKLIETKHRRKDGTVIDVEIRVVRVEIDNRQLVFGAVRDITERKRAQEALQASLQEKELLLKEVHHRVKNNLQIISSLLHLQSLQVVDPRDLELFNDSQGRVRTMALIHESLYRSGDLSRIGMREYLNSLAVSLVRSHAENASTVRITTRIEPEDLTMDISVSIPIALIVTELLTNALKYAFPEGRQGKILVELVCGQNACTLTVADNGAGIPEDVDFHKTPTLGMQLVMSLTRQLGGFVRLERDGGSKFVVEFGR